jgi:hypothetical protein
VKEMLSATGDTNLAIYSDLVSKAVKLAKRFSEFTSLIDTDQVKKYIADPRLFFPELKTVCRSHL